MTPFIRELPRHYSRSPQDAELQRVLERIVIQAEEDKDFTLMQLFPSTATGWGLALWEKAYGLRREPDQTEEQRRACILAKIKQVGPSTPELLKAVAQCFSAYPVELVEYPAEYRFELWYIGTIGTIRRPDELRAAVNERKPAHLAWKFGYRETCQTKGFIGMAPREAEMFILRQRPREYIRYRAEVFEGFVPRTGETVILKQEV